jgi:DNA-binding beta-propeller fold protein YncE
VSDVALGAGRVWAVSYADSKLFPIRGGAARKPMRVPLNPLEGMLIHEGRLWVASSGADRVSVIDATSGVRLRTADVGDSPGDVAVLDGSMWVLNELDATITPLDSATGEPGGEPVRVPGNPVALDAGFGRLWVVDCRDGALLAVDPDSDRVLSRLEIGRGANDVVAFAGAVWVTNWRSHSLIRIDPTNVSVEAEVDAGDTPGELAGGRSGLWVADTRGTRIIRVNPRTNRIVETLKVGEAPTALAVGPRFVWVVDRHNLLRVRVGVLGSRKRSGQLQRSPVIPRRESSQGLSPRPGQLYRQGPRLLAAVCSEPFRDRYLGSRRRRTRDALSMLSMPASRVVVRTLECAHTH